MQGMDSGEGRHVIRAMTMSAVLAWGISGCSAILPAAWQVLEPNTSAPAPAPEPEGPLWERAGALVNAQRRARGLPALAHNTLLDRVALRHARDMTRTGRLDHVAPDGRGPHQRLKDAGYGPCKTAETLGRGYPDLQSAFAGWMRSRPHRRIILLPDVEEFGIGHDPAGEKWAMMLARPGC